RRAPALFRRSHSPPSHGVKMAKRTADAKMSCHLYYTIHPYIKPGQNGPNLADSWHNATPRLHWHNGTAVAANPYLAVHQGLTRKKWCATTPTHLAHWHNALTLIPCQ